MLTSILTVLISTGLVQAKPNGATAKINPRVFGTSLLYYRPDGYGTWDPNAGRPVPEAVKLMRSAGITVIRYPGGCAGHNYEWKKAIGAPPHPRMKHGSTARDLFSLDEFVTLCKAVGAEPLFTVSFFRNTPEEAGELVEYCNGPTTSTWGAKRAANGYPEPHHIRLWEIGNETSHGDHVEVHRVSDDEYAAKAAKFAREMKAKDPGILIGVSQPSVKLFKLAGDLIDFREFHAYLHAHQTDQWQDGTGDPAEYFRGLLADPLRWKSQYQLALKDLDAMMAEAGCSPRKRPFGLGVTEYNTNIIARDANREWQYSLGVALAVGDYFRVLMDGENRVVVANYWNYINEVFGMVKGLGPYVKRPAQHVFEMFHQHFGPWLTDVRVVCDGYVPPAIDVGGTVDLTGVRCPAGTARMRMTIDWQRSGARDDICMFRNFTLIRERDLTETNVLPTPLAGLTDAGDVLTIDLTKETGPLCAEFPVACGYYRFACDVRGSTGEPIRIESTRNLIRNGTFDPETGLARWMCPSLSETSFHYDPNVGHDAKGSLRVDFKWTRDRNLYHPVQLFDVEQDSIYELTAWLKADLDTDCRAFGVAVQDVRHWTRHNVDTWIEETRYDWRPIKLVFTVPESRNITTLKVMLRHPGYGHAMKNTGSLWLDDLNVRRIGRGPSTPAVTFTALDVKATGLARTVLPIRRRYPFWHPFESFRAPFLAANASLSDAGDTAHAIVLNRDLENARPARIAFGPPTNDTVQNGDHIFFPTLAGRWKPTGAWVLTGPSVDATNEDDPNCVKTVKVDVPKPGENEWYFTFPPHSMTAIDFITTPAAEQYGGVAK